MSRSKLIFFVTIITLAGIILVLVVSEILLRYKKHDIESSDHIDYGMTVYDEYLGWRLTPDWRGQHKNYDFDVGYSINLHGFRKDSNAKQERVRLRYAFVGDSFTFSFGVNDDETFIHLLNSQEKQDNVYLNFGVPGYSTDQEYLLIRDRVLHFSPDVVLLVVYLGNDLLDNEFPYPLQANRAKPYYELKTDELILRNTPVPTVPKPPELYKKNLSRVVLGDGFNPNGFTTRMVKRFELLKLIKKNFFKQPNYSAQFEERFDHTLDLFASIIGQVHEVCNKKNIKLDLVLMPGRLYVEQPDSISAQFQEHLRKEIVGNRDDMGVDVIDLATHLRERYMRDPGRWYYPHEGHLTPEGHRVVYDIFLHLLQ